MKKERTKLIRISESVHTKLKIHSAKKKKSITEFANNSLLNAIKNDLIEKQ